jgi:hypothetical protein
VITLLTATGCRPQAWAICERLMARQTYAGLVRWIIVDDGEEPQPVTFKRPGWTLEVVRPEVKWRPGLNTQACNLLEGLDCVRDDERLVVIEDDDCYAPEYLERVNGWLDRAELVGEIRARYYQLPTGKYRQLGNHQHASLCSTGLRGRDALHLFRAECLRQDKFIDLGLWRKFGGSRALHDSAMVVGLKGLPGRGGIGMGHRDDFAAPVDRSRSVLRQWVGVNIDLYEGLT